MELGRTLYVADRKAWRAWLKRHHTDNEGVWLIYHRKSSGKPRIPYNDAVEEALCFGWIDSTVKRMDDERFAQRFSPRRKNSVLSQMNKERIRKLFSQRRMTKVGLAAVSHAFSHAPDRRESEIAEDILKEIRANSEAWKRFQRLPEAYKRIRIAYIEGRRGQGEDAFQRSLGNFIRMTAKGRRFGMVRG